MSDTGRILPHRSAFMAQNCQQFSSDSNTNKPLEPHQPAKKKHGNCIKHIIMLTISLPNYGCLAKPVLSSILEIPFCNRPSGSRPYIISCMLYNIQYLFHCGHFKNIASRGNDFLYRISSTSVEVYCLFMFSEELKSYLLQLYDYYIIYSRVL